MIINADGKVAGNFEKVFSFDDTLLVPNYSDIESRQEVDIGNNLGPHQLNIPIISSPMDTVTESDMAVAMSDAGGLGIVHRYDTVEVQAAYVSRALRDPGCRFIGAAVGVPGDGEERAIALVDAGS